MSTSTHLEEEEEEEEGGGGAWEKENKKEETGKKKKKKEEEREARRNSRNEEGGGRTKRKTSKSMQAGTPGQAGTETKESRIHSGNCNFFCGWRGNFRAQLLIPHALHRPPIYRYVESFQLRYLA